MASLTLMMMMVSWWCPGTCTFILVLAPPQAAKQPALSLGQRFFRNSINCTISSAPWNLKYNNWQCMFQHQTLLFYGIWDWQQHSDIFRQTLWSREGGKAKWNIRFWFPIINFSSPWFWCMLQNIATPWYPNQKQDTKITRLHPKMNFLSEN